MLTIRPATSNDFINYKLVHEKSFMCTSILLNTNYFNNIITSGNRFLYLAEVDGQVIGAIYCFLWEHPKLKTTAEIQNLCVLQEHRQHGIATKLVDYLVNEMKNKCKYFEIVDQSGGITGRIVSKMGFKSISEYTYQRKSI